MTRLMGSRICTRVYYEVFEKLDSWQVVRQVFRMRRMVRPIISKEILRVLVQTPSDPQVTKFYIKRRRDGESQLSLSPAKYLLNLSGWLRVQLSEWISCLTRFV